MHRSCAWCEQERHKHPVIHAATILTSSTAERMAFGTVVGARRCISRTNSLRCWGEGHACKARRQSWRRGRGKRAFVTHANVNIVAVQTRLLCTRVRRCSCNNHKTKDRRPTQPPATNTSSTERCVVSAAPHNLIRSSDQRLHRLHPPPIDSIARLCKTGGNEGLGAAKVMTMVGASQQCDHTRTHTHAHTHTGTHASAHRSDKTNASA